MLFHKNLDIDKNLFNNLMQYADEIVEIIINAFQTNVVKNFQKYVKEFIFVISRLLCFKQV